MLDLYEPWNCFLHFQSSVLSGATIEDDPEAECRRCCAFNFPVSVLLMSSSLSSLSPILSSVLSIHFSLFLPLIFSPPSLPTSHTPPLLHFSWPSLSSLQLPFPLSIPPYLPLFMTLPSSLHSLPSPSLSLPPPSPTAKSIPLGIYMNWLVNSHQDSYLRNSHNKKETNKLVFI